MLQENRFGYKAGVFKDIPVIIKLFIPKEARVAIPTEENKASHHLSYPDLNAF